MIVIVEGKNDYNKIKSVFPEFDVLITNGSAVDARFIKMLKQINESQEVILCLDPDYAGEKIRKQIADILPYAKHIFAPRELSLSKNGRKIGIEHMNTNDIRSIFANIKIPNYREEMTIVDMVDLGLSGKVYSRQLREKLGIHYNIGYANSKQFLKRLNMFNISKEEIMKNI